MSANLSTFKRLLWAGLPAVPKTTAPFNQNVEEDDEPQVAQVDPRGGLRGRLLSALNPQESVQPQIGRPFSFQRPQPGSMNSRSWDTTDTGGRAFTPDDGPSLRPPATRPRLVPPAQVKPLIRSVPQNQTDNPPTPAAPDIERNPLMGFGTDTTILPESVTPKLTRPLPELPDRTLSVEEAQQNFLQYQRAARQQRIDELSDPHFQPPKGQGGFKHRLVRGLKVGGEVALENLGQTGNPLSAAGAFLGGGAVGVADRRSQGSFLAHRELGQLQQAEQYGLGRQGEQAKIAAQQAETDLRNSQIPYWQSRPDLEAQKQKDAAAQRERQAVLANIRLLRGQQLDPNNPRHAALLERAANAGIEIDPESFNDASSNLVPVDEVQPDNTKRRRWFNKATGELSDVGPVTGYVQPVIGAGPHAGQTPNQVDVSADRKRALGQGDKRIVQGTERIGIARDNAVQRGQSPANMNARRARAAALNNELEKAKAQAAAPPHALPGKDGSITTTDEWRAAYTQRKKEEARRYMQQIADAYGDIYETGDDGDGWAYAKPKVQPNAGAPAVQGGAYAGHRFSRSQLPEIRKRLGVGSDAEAERIITQQGGVFY